MSDRALVIANPQAGEGKAKNRWWADADRLAERLGPHDIVWTEASGHAERLAREEGGSRPLLVAYGGDGTVSEVARGLALSGGDAELGLLPCGTGNDFAGDAGVPLRLPEAARFLSRTPALPTDLGRVEDADGASRLFLNSFSVGLAAAVNDRAARSGGLGRATYVAATAREVLAYAARPFWVGFDEARARPLLVLNLSVLNSRRFGGGIRLAPPADPGDGRLDAVLIGPLAPLALLNAVARLTQGTHLQRREFEHHSITRMKIAPVAGDAKILSEADGEVRRWTLPLTVSVAPGAVRVRRAPPGPGA